MKGLSLFTIEHKILIPFVCITMGTIACLCVLFYRIEYRIMLEAEGTNAQRLVEYIRADMEDGGYQENPEGLLEKYRNSYRGSDLFIYDGEGNLLLGSRERDAEEVILAHSQENRLGWSIVYALDKQVLQDRFVYEQRYVILGAVAMLLVIVQASTLIAHHISSPIWELGQLCTRISQVPEQSEVWMPSYSRRRDELGQLAGAFQAMMERLQGYTRELSRVKALNESIVENLPLGVLVYDENRTVIFRNTRADTMLARLEERDEQGRTLQELLEEMSHRDIILPARVRLREPDGRWRTIELGAWHLGSPEGERCGTLYTMDDVTYQRHMEQKISRDEKLAYTGQLAADIAHEVRNPLAGIRAGLQVVGRKLSEERDSLLCQEMVKEVDRVNLLVENLLNLSRKRESEKTTVALNGLGEEMSLLYSKVAENKGVRLTVDMEEALWVLADEQELRQILINLINNSIKALLHGGTVTLRGCCRAGSVSVVVEDNGPGMERETLERALRGEGGGLGLSIVRRLAEQNGGALHFETIPGQGCQAILTFHGTGGSNCEV